MRHYYKLSAFCAISLALLHASAHAIVSPLDSKARGVTWTLVEPEVVGTPGETVIVHIKGEIPKGWHTYSLKKYKLGPTSTEIRVEPSDLAGLVAESVSYDPKPKPDVKTREIFGLDTDVESFEGSVVISVPLKIAATATAESIKVSLFVTSAICDENTCKPKTDTELSPIVILKKKVSEGAAGNFTFTHTPGATHRTLEWTLADSQKKLNLRAREGVVLQVECMIENGWHTFATKQDPQTRNAAITEFSIDPKLGSIDTNKIRADRDPVVVFDTEGGKVDTFNDKVVFSVPVYINANLAPGTYPFTLNIASQACSEGENGRCKQMRGAVSGEMVIGEGKAAVVNSGGSDADGISLDKGLWAFLWTAALYGAISLLTPCVFPMIPITVSFFTKREHVSHLHAVRDALIFSFGIIFTFVGLGFFLALVMGQSVRNLAANPWMNLGIFAVFIVMAGNLLGYYELQVPAGILNALNKKASKGNSVMSLLLMGLVFSMTSFTCTGPFVGTVMVWAVNGGNWLWPMLGTAVFATVFAAPFFLLALFPTALKSLPKSGGWLNSVKVVMGLVEIAAALKFLSSADLVWHWGILTRTVFVVVWLVVALLTVLYLLGYIRFPHDSQLKKVSWVRKAFVGVFCGLALLLVADLTGKEAMGEFISSILPPREYPPMTTDDWESGIAAGKKAGKPVFFDFTGVTCVNCRKMENGMFKRKDVEELLKNYVVIRLYTDVANTHEERLRSERNSKVQLDRFHTETLPYYAIVEHDGKLLGDFPEGYTQDVDKFTTFLKQALAARTAVPAAASPAVLPAVQVNSSASVQN